MSRTLKYLKHAICSYRSVKKGPSDVILLNYFDLAIEWQLKLFLAKMLR